MNHDREPARQTRTGTAEAGDAVRGDRVGGPPNGKDDVNGSATRTGGAPITDECRRLAELLHLDAVGVMSTASGRRKVAWWAVPHSPPLPSRLDDVLQGRTDGWIVSLLAHGAVFARMTPATSVRSASILKTLGPSLAAAVEGEVAGLAQVEAQALREEMGLTVDRADPRPPSPLGRDGVGVLERAADAIKRLLGVPGAGPEDLLEAVRQAIGADELFFLSERDDDIEILAVPDGDRPRRIPPEVRAEFTGLPPRNPIDDAAARQLGVVLGARAPHLSAAFCSDAEPMEAVIAGWRNDPSLPHEFMGVIARVVAAGRAAIESRERAVDALMAKERTRLAYGIHDSLTQAVTSAVLELEGLRSRIEEDPVEAIEILDATKAEIRRNLGDLRDILFDLSPEDEGNGPSEELLVAYVRDVVRRWRLPAKVSVEGDPHAISRPVLEAAYVVIRESLANAAKHASSKNVAVRVRVGSDAVEVEVEDGGRGFSTAGGGRRTKHFGLEMMRTRVEEVGGTLEIDSSPEKGTRVVARLPVRSQGDTP